MKTPVTLKGIQHHFAYSWWKYVILAAASIMGWSICFAVTAYRPPEEKKIVVGLYANGFNEQLSEYMEQVRLETMPEMELMEAQYIMPDEAYGEMIIHTRIAARECDLYVMPRAEFQSYASQAAFMPLDEACPELVTELRAAGVSLSRGERALAEELGESHKGEKHLYGIPCADLPGASRMMGFDASDFYISIFFETGNDENCIKFFETFVRELMQPVEEVPSVTAEPAAA